MSEEYGGDFITIVDDDGKEFELESDGLLAVCICHEYDHLEGILFIDKAIDGVINTVEETEE